jgi:excisionase family DNA binding protein
MSEELYSVEQVADRLGLHVRTVRGYVRDRRLNAVKIGKQYRIARADLEAFTGGPLPASRAEGVRRRRTVEVSSIVQVDAISPEEVQRITNTLMGALAGRRDDDRPVRVETVYDEDLARLKIIVLGGIATSAELLRLLGAATEVSA